MLNLLSLLNFHARVVVLLRSRSCRRSYIASFSASSCLVVCAPVMSAMGGSANWGAVFFRSRAQQTQHLSYALVAKAHHPTATSHAPALATMPVSTPTLEGTAHPTATTAPAKSSRACQWAVAAPVGRTAVPSICLLDMRCIVVGQRPLVSSAPSSSAHAKEPCVGKARRVAVVVCA